MNDKFDELAMNLAQSVTRRGALRDWGAGLAGILLMLGLGQAPAGSFRLGPLLDLSDPDAIAACGSNAREKESYERQIR